MRLLMVVQRYGAAVPGGAETAARLLAERMAGAGHEVSVLSSCAIDYATWEDHFQPGPSVENGVAVTRLPVIAPRDPARFNPLSGRVLGQSRVSPTAQDAWMYEQGPVLAGFGATLRHLAASNDVTAFMTYLYPTTVHGLPMVAPHGPTVLHPTAHDEVPFRLPIIRTAFDHATALAYFSAEEQELVDLRCRPRAITGVVPLGIDLPTQRHSPTLFREKFGLGSDDYLLYLGRVDPNKGAAELLHMYDLRRSRHPELRLVMMGAEMMEVGQRPGVTVTGFVDDEVKQSAISGALALVQPSRQESFSIALAESWAAGVPVLVQGACDVLAGFTDRASGGLAYHDQAEFDAAVGLLESDSQLRARLGESGRDHVAEYLAWPAVIAAYETLLEQAVAQFHRDVGGSAGSAG